MTSTWKNPRSLKLRTERDQNIMSQEWKAKKLAYKFNQFTGVSIEELRSAALENICKVYSSWDPSKGANFSTWTNRNLFFHLCNLLRDRSRLIKIPRSYSDLYLKIRKLRASNPDWSAAKIAQHLEVETVTVSEVDKAFSMRFFPINEESIEPEGEFDHYVYDLNEVLLNVSELSPLEEQFMNDYYVKKVSLTTLKKKYKDFIFTQEDADSYANGLKNTILGS